MYKIMIVLSMVVCCSTRDELDAVCSSISNISYIFVTPLYSDLTKAECALILDKFRYATIKWNQNSAAIQSVDEKEEQKSHMIVATNACLLASRESSISCSVVINYELPTKKVLLENYTRRMTTYLATNGIVINMVVVGEVVTLKSKGFCASRWHCSLANYVILVERIKQFMNIPSELPAIVEDNRPPSSWPSMGRIQFQDLKGCILLFVTMSSSEDTQAANNAQKLLDSLSSFDQNVIQMAKANYFTHFLHRLSSEVKMSMVTTVAEMEFTDQNKSSLFDKGALDHS
ncbi:hypothetical protein Lser_V15G39351 [Lactuca serriola]